MRSTTASLPLRPVMPSTKAAIPARPEALEIDGGGEREPRDRAEGRRLAGAWVLVSSARAETRERASLWSEHSTRSSDAASVAWTFLEDHEQRLVLRAIEDGARDLVSKTKLACGDAISSTNAPSPPRRRWILDPGPASGAPCREGMTSHDAKRRLATLARPARLELSRSRVLPTPFSRDEHHATPPARAVAERLLEVLESGAAPHRTAWGRARRDAIGWRSGSWRCPPGRGSRHRRLSDSRVPVRSSRSSDRRVVAERLPHGEIACVSAGSETPPGPPSFISSSR